MNCSLNGRRKILRHLVGDGCSTTFPSEKVENVRKSDVKKEQIAHLNCLGCNIVEVFMLREAHMSTFRRLVVAAVVLNALGTAVAAEVTVDKDPPKRAKEGFFERVQAGELADAIARRGQPVDVKPGQYHLRVPCDSMKPGSFVDITVTIDDNSKTRLRLEECGVEVDSR
jgi:hypothetical protein